MESFKKTSILNEQIIPYICENKQSDALGNIPHSMTPEETKMCDNVSSKEEIILFLRNLADSIENNTLQSEQLEKVGEFFMSYKMTQNENKNTEEEFDTMDVIKFITMGWYIYSILLDKDKTPIEESSCSE